MTRTRFTSSTARRLADGAKAGATDFRGAITLSGNGLVYIRLRPELDSNTIRLKEVPIEVTIPEGGLYKGYTLPIWNDALNVDEQLSFRQNVPRRWDEASDITASVVAALDTANTGKKFRLQVAWEHFAKGGVVPASSNPVPCEHDTGTTAQYKSFVCDFTIQYDIDGVGDEIKYGEVLVARLRRVDASADEIAGNVVILDWYIGYRRDKLGAATA